MNNASRFISAYNKIDKAIRARLNLKHSLTFTDIIRKAALVNAIVRKFETEILDYGRLRNAIVHSSNNQKIIAQPNDGVVEDFEHIASLIASPPKAHSFAQKAVSAPYDTPLKSAILTMANNNYSNLPLIRDEEIIGVLSNKLIVEFLSKYLRTSELDEIFKTATVFDALGFDSRHYIIKNSATCGIDEILNEFSQNRKLQIVLLTSNGLNNGVLEGVITTGDIIDIKLENF